MIPLTSQSAPSSSGPTEAPVYKLILNGNNYYLIGYFNKRKDSLSVYRVDRMRFVINHNSEYEDIRDQFDMEKEFDKNVNMYLSNEKIDLKIIFDKKVLKEIVKKRLRLMLRMYGQKFE